MRCPSRVPGLIRMVNGSLRVTTPSPLQTLQTVRAWPEPPQRGQVTLNFMRPLVCVTCPLPPHSGHGPGLSRYPRPAQLAQTSWRLMVSRNSAPRIACQKPTLTWYSRSEPGCGPALKPSSLAPRPPPKMLLKMSRKPPLLVLVRLPAPPVPAPLLKSEKSKPLKSKGTPCAPPPRVPVEALPAPPPELYPPRA